MKRFGNNNLIEKHKKEFKMKCRIHIELIKIK